jgi:hypothetical protein
MPQGRTNASDEREGNCLKWSTIQQQSSAVSKRYGHGLDDRRTRVRFSARWAAEYLFAVASKQEVDSTQPPNRQLPRVLRRRAVTLLPSPAQYGRKNNLNYIFISKLSFTASSKANLVLSTPILDDLCSNLNAAVGYCLSFTWWDELWTVTVSMSFPQVRNEYAAPAEE